MTTSPRFTASKPKLAMTIGSALVATAAIVAATLIALYGGEATASEHPVAQGNTGYLLQARLNVSIPGVDRATSPFRRFHVPR